MLKANVFVSVNVILCCADYLKIHKAIGKLHNLPYLLNILMNSEAQSFSIPFFSLYYKS